MQQNSSYVVSSYPQLKNNSTNKIPNQELIPNKGNLNNEDTKHLLFFSNYCQHSKKLLNELIHKGILEKVELICIDDRYVKENITYIVLNNQQNMPLPPMIHSVPTLCILPNHEILKGSQIIHYFIPISKTIEDEREKINIEPNPFDFANETTGMFGVSSDHFSFWDSEHEELSASGSGGMKQLYDYVCVNNDTTDQIYTPPDHEEVKNNISIEQFQQQRQNEI